MTEQFDAVVIGGGMSGLPLALRAAKHGRVALIEKELLGGTCLNRGCIPTKTMIASADVAHSARTAATFGVHVSSPTVDLVAIVDRSLYRDGNLSIADRIVPHTVFVDPEVGSVGLTEQQARDAGYDVAIGTQKFDGVVKARAMDKTIGLIKFVVDHATDKILGCHIAGPHGGDLVHEAALAMVVGAMIHVHPTLSEGINSAAGGVHRPSSERPPRNHHE